MFRNRIIPLVLLLGIWLTACGASPATKAIPTQEVKTTTASSNRSGLPVAQIARHPDPADYSSINNNPSVPKYDPNSTDPWQIDFRSSNLSKLDLSKSKEDLLY